MIIPLSTLFEEVTRYHPNPDLKFLEKAYNFAVKAHEGQVRASGEPYINHLIETALLVCKLKLDIPSVVAALLHDSIEDCNTTKKILSEEFGEDVAEIVDGVTKLTRVQFDSREEKQAESFRKMLIAMAKDIRVVLVKLCDRLHNMRTLSSLSEEKRRAIALETKEIYAPLANRLGINWIKSELEDLCLLHLRPEIYHHLVAELERTNPDREVFLRETAEELQKKLEEAGVSAQVSGRVKHISSIFAKMEKDSLSFEEVMDVIGFRVIVSSVRACYETLGIIHSNFKPVPGRVKDYIAMPKPNMYQSLHTTVISSKGARIEVQIRTFEMNRIAEEGIAAHWRYKEGGSSLGFDLSWVKDLVETQAYLKNPDEFIQSVKGELFPEDVFVFTPKGDLFRLPASSTPIDFAYAIHTDVGHQTIGARVNGSIVPLEHKLSNGDTVQVITQRGHVPSKDWLRFVVSGKARQRIRAFLKAEEQARSISLGSDILAKDLRKVKLSLKKLEKEGKLKLVAESMGLKGETDLYAAIGYGKVSSPKVVAKLLPTEPNVEQKLIEVKSSPLQRIFQRAAKASRERVGIKVSGLDDVLVRFAKCCEPLPGDRIVGFITRGRGVTIHASHCSEILNADPLRYIPVQWDNEISKPRRVSIVVTSQDQLGILAKMTTAITSNGINIVSASMKTSPSGKAINQFELEISDAKQLHGLKRSLELLPGVIKVDRIVGGEK
jgi:GTP pyrophosphokinase